MIEKTSAYRVGDKIFASFEAAQLDALTGMFDDLFTVEGTVNSSTIAGFVSKRKDEVIAVLSMGEPVARGRKPRSDQGKPHKPRKAKAPVEEPSPGIKVEASDKYAGK